MGRLRNKHNGTLRPARWTLAQQVHICQLLADQLQQGFSLKQALSFLRSTDRRLPTSLARVEQRLDAGADLVTSLAPYLQPNAVFQLQLTTAYGDLATGLQHAATLLRLLATQRKRLRQLIAYPLGLLVGMGILFGALQWGVLPQLQANLAPQATLSGSAWHFTGHVVILISLVAGGWTFRWWRRQPILWRAAGALRWPIVGPIFQAYYAYYLMETLSQLVLSGLSVKQMLTVLRQLPERALLYQLATVLTAQLTQGTVPLKWLQRQAYVPGQLLVLLQKGSTMAQLGRELRAYSELQYRELVRRCETGLAWVQPVLLTVVATLIVGAYLKMLLPLYQNLQGVYQ